MSYKEFLDFKQSINENYEDNLQNQAEYEATYLWQFDSFKKLKRKCRQMTAHSYPSQITAEEFYATIIESKNSFINNMNHLGYTFMWAEDWMETLQAWIEMEKGDLTN